MQIIDAHVHPFEVVSQRSGRYSEGVTDMEVFKEDLERAGITHCCGSVISRVDGSSWEAIHALNEAALRLRKAYEGFYTPGIHVHPAFPQGILRRDRKDGCTGCYIDWRIGAVYDGMELVCQSGGCGDFHVGTGEGNDGQCASFYR